jgi:hypothetical protein
MELTAAYKTDIDQAGSQLQVLVVLGSHREFGIRSTMATASQANNESDHNKVAISMGILVVVIAIIIIAVWFTNRIRLPAVIPLSVRNQRRREDELYRKEMGQFLLESLPVIRYNSRLQPKARRVTSIYNPATGALAGTNDVGSNEESEKQTAAIDRSRIDDANTSDNKIVTPQEGKELQNEDQQNSRDGTVACSVCTEDFAENDRVRILPCGHLYHKRCIDPWLLGFSGNCPLW